MIATIAHALSREKTHQFALSGGDKERLPLNEVFLLKLLIRYGIFVENGREGIGYV